MKRVNILCWYFGADRPRHPACLSVGVSATHPGVSRVVCTAKCVERHHPEIACGRTRREYLADVSGSLSPQFNCLLHRT
jgi:hypothetical protein